MHDIVYTSNIPLGFFYVFFNLYSSLVIGRCGCKELHRDVSKELQKYCKEFQGACSLQVGGNSVNF